MNREIKSLISKFGTIWLSDYDEEGKRSVTLWRTAREAIREFAEKPPGDLDMTAEEFNQGMIVALEKFLDDYDGNAIIDVATNSFDRYFRERNWGTKDWGHPQLRDTFRNMTLWQIRKALDYWKPATLPELVRMYCELKTDMNLDTYEVDHPKMEEYVALKSLKDFGINIRDHWYIEMQDIMGCFA